jgi:hypothetical protein
VLASGERVTGQLLAQRQMGIKVFGDQALFQPGQPVGP